MNSFFRRARIALALWIIPKPHSSDQLSADVVSSLLSGRVHYPVKELRIDVTSDGVNRRRRFHL